MSHPLSERLQALAALLDENPQAAGDKDIVKELDAAAKHVQKASDLIELRAAGFSPLSGEVRELLREAFDRDEKGLKAFAKSMLGKAPAAKKGASGFAAYLDQVLAHLALAKQLEKARNLLKRQLAITPVDLDRTDRDEVLVEIRKLGTMDPQRLKKEFARLAEKPAKVQRIAEIAGVWKPKAPAKQKPTDKPPLTATLLKKLIKLGATFQENRGV